MRELGPSERAAPVRLHEVLRVRPGRARAEVVRVRHHVQQCHHGLRLAGQCRPRQTRLWQYYSWLVLFFVFRLWWTVYNLMIKLVPSKQFLFL